MGADLSKNNRIIVAVVPTYDETGDCTYMYYSDGNVDIIPRPVNTVIRKLFYMRGYKIAALRQMLAGDGPRKDVDKLPLDPLHTFLAAKCRVARITGDRAYGFINVNVISYFKLTLDEETQEAIIAFPKHPIHILQNFYTFLYRFKDAYALHYLLLWDELAKIQHPANRMNFMSIGAPLGLKSF